MGACLMANSVLPTALHANNEADIKHRHQKNVVFANLILQFFPILLCFTDEIVEPVGSNKLTEQVPL